MSRGFRTLLPAPGRHELPSTGSESAEWKQGETIILGKKRVGTNNACVECRVRKIRCNSERPRCFNCQKRGMENCVYLSISSGGAAATTIKILQTLPMDRAIQTLNRLRETGNSTAALLAVIDSASSNRSPLPDRTYQDHPALGFSSLEQELTEQYPIAYPSFQPVSAMALRESNLLGPIREALGQSAHQTPPHGRSQPTQMGSEDMDGRKTRYMDSDSAVRRFHPYGDPIGQPQSVLDYYEKRLQDLDMSHWTDVHVSSAFAAHIIMLYLRTDHPLLGIFDPCLFIEDLVDRRHRYCSRFLVNAVMFLGCQMYSAFNKDAMKYVDLFGSNIKALSAAEEEHNSPLNMAALILTSLALMVQGRDTVVFKCIKNAIRMGMQLGFFPSSNSPPADLTQLSDEDVRVNSHAAWGVFCWSTFLALFYRQPGLEAPKSAPNLPIPKGPSFSRISGRVSESGSFEGQDLMGSTFSVLCEFWSMIHEGIWIYYRERLDSPPEAWRSKLAEHKFREIIAWTTSLPPSLIRAKDSGPHVPVFHIWLHAALLDIVRPFTSEVAQKEQPWKTFIATNSSASTAYNASVNQLKRLILDYRTNYETSTYSILWHTGLLYLINAILETPRDPEWHLYLLLCIYGYESLRRPYSISGSIGKSLLTMALRDTDMSGEEARKVLNDLENDDLSHLKDHLRATFMADLKMAQIDPENATVENSAKGFESWALLSDFLWQEQMDGS